MIIVIVRRVRRDGLRDIPYGDICQTVCLLPKLLHVSLLYHVLGWKLFFLCECHPFEAGLAGLWLSARLSSPRRVCVFDGYVFWIRDPGSLNQNFQRMVYEGGFRWAGACKTAAAIQEMCSVAPRGQLPHLSLSLSLFSLSLPPSSHLCPLSATHVSSSTLPLLLSFSPLHCFSCRLCNCVCSLFLPPPTHTHTHTLSLSLFFSPLLSLKFNRPYGKKMYIFLLFRLRCYSSWHTKTFRWYTQEPVCLHLNKPIPK